MSLFILRTILCSSLFAVGLGSLNSHNQQHSTIRGSKQSPIPTTTTNTNNKNSTALPPLKTTRSGGKSTRIVGGQVANPGWYPYMVSLQDSSGTHVCGGSVVAPDIILSASHCVPLGIATVVVGAFDLGDYSSGNVETFGIKKMYIHPDYNDFTFEYDVLVIKLDGQITVTDPVRLNADYNVPNPSNVLTSIGWGATSEDGFDYPNLLQEAELFYVPNRICKNIVDDDGYSYGTDLTSDMMCATAEGQVACYGDSGGPLLLLGSSPAEDVQVGIVSWGAGSDCAGPVPVIYQRLPFTYQWIQSLVCSRSAAPPAHFNC